MSSIDERVVQLEFVNKDFERNVATSIGTLNKLKEALQFNDVSSSLDRLEKNVNAADFSKLAASIESISNRFSTFGIVGMTVIQDLVHAAEGLGVSLYNSTIGQIKSGGWRRATNIDKAKFQIEGLGRTWADVQKEVSDAVDGTRFGLDAAASAAGQFLASGVQLGEEMGNALKSVAAVASQTNSEYEEIAHIYTTIAGNGKVMAEQLNQFSYRGLNAAAMVAEALHKTEAEVRDMASKGELDFKTFSDAMLSQLDGVAARANETFEGSMANMNAALSRIGEPFAASYRKNMIPVFNSLRVLINKIKKVVAPVADLFDDFATKASAVIVEFVDKFDTSGIERFVGFLSDMYMKFDNFFSSINSTWKKTATAFDNVRYAASYAEDFTMRLGDAVGKITGFPNLINQTNELNTSVEKAGDALDNFKKAGPAMGKWMEQQSGLAGTLAYQLAEQKNGALEEIPVIERLAGAFSRWFDQIRIFLYGSDTDNRIPKIVHGIASALEIVLRVGIVIVDSVLDPALWVLDGLIDILSDGITVLALWVDRFKEMLGLAPDGNDFSAYSILHDILSKVLYVVAGILRTGEKVVGFLLNNTIDIIGTLIVLLIQGVQKVKDFWNIFKDTDAFKALKNSFDSLKAKFTELKEKGFDRIKQAIEDFKNNKLKLPTFDLDKLIDTVGELADKVTNFFTWLTDHIDVEKVLTDVGNALSALWGIITNGAKFLGGIALDALSVVFSLIGKIGTAAFETVSKVKDFWNVFKDTQAFKVLKESFDKIVAKFTELKEKGFDRIKQAIDKFKNTKLNLPTVNLDKVIDTVGKFTDKITIFFNWLTDHIDVEKLLDTIGNGLSTLWTIISNIGKFIGGVAVTAFQILLAVFSRIGAVIHDLTSRFDEFWASFKDSEVVQKLSDKFEILKNSISNIKEQIKAQLDKLKNSFEGVSIPLPSIDFEKIGTAIANFAGKVMDFVTWLTSKVDVEKIIETIRSGLSSVWGILKTVGSVVGTVAITAFKLLGLAVVVVALAIRDLIVKLKNLWNSVKESAGFKRLVDSFGLLKDKLVEIKEKGVKAIKNLFSRLKGAKANLPTNALNKLADAIGKVLSRVGEFITVAVRKIDVDKLLDTIGNVLEKIGKVLSNVVNIAIKVFNTAFKIAVDLISKGATALKELWESIKGSKAFDSLKKAGEALLDFMGGLWDSIVNFFQNGEFTLPEIDGDAIFQGVKDGFFGVRDWLVEKWEDLKTWIKEKWDGLFSGQEDEEGGYQLPAIDIEAIKAKVDEFVQWLQEKLDAIKGFFADIFGGETEEEEKEPSAFMEALKSALISLGEEAVLTGIDALSKLVGVIGDIIPLLTEAAGAAVTGGIESLSDFIDQLNQSKDIKDKLDKIKNVMGVILKIILALKGFKALASIADFLSYVKDAVKNLSGVFKEAQKTMKKYGKLLTAQARDLNATALLKVAGAIFLLSLAFKALGSIDENKFAQAASGMVLIGAILASLAFILTRNQGGRSGTPEDAISNGLSKIGEGIASFGKSLGKALKGFGIAAELLAFVFAIKSIVGLAKDISSQDPGTLASGIHVVSDVMLELVGSMSTLNLTSKGNTIGTGLGVAAELIALALAMKSIAKTLIKLKDIPQEDLDKASDAIIGVINLAMKLSLLGGFDSKSSSESVFNKSKNKKNLDFQLFKQGSSSSEKRNSKWKTILATAALIWVVGNALCKLSSVDEGKLEAATNAMTAVLGTCVTLLLASSVIEDESSASEFAKEWNKDGGLASKLFGKRTGNKSSSSSASSSNTAYKNIKAIIGLMIVTAAALFVLAKYAESDKLQAATDAIVSIMTVCMEVLLASSAINDKGSASNFEGEGGLMGKIFGKRSKAKSSGKENAGWKNLKTLILLIATVAAAIFVLSKWGGSADKMEAAGKAITSILGVCVLLLGASIFVNSGGSARSNEGGLMGKIFGKSSASQTSNNTAWSVVLSVCAMLIAIAGALLIVGQLDVDKIEAAGDAVEKIVLVTSVLMLATGAMLGFGSKSGTGLLGSFDALKQWSTVAAGLVSAFGMLAMVVLALKTIVDLDMDPEKLEVASTSLLTVLAGIALGLIGMSTIGNVDLGVLAVIGIISGIFSIFEALKEQFGLDDKGNYKDGFMGGLAEFWDNFKAGFLEGMRFIGQAINEFLSGLTGSENLGKEVKDGIGGIGEDLSEGATGMMGGVSKFLEDVKNFDLGEVITSVAEDLKQIPGDLKDFAVDMQLFAAEAAKITDDDITNMTHVLEILAGATIADLVVDIIETFVGNGEDDGLIGLVKKLEGDFMTDLKKFIGKVQSLNSDDLDPLVGIMEAMAKIAALDFLTGTMQWLVGKADFSSITENLPALARAMMAYSDELKHGNLDVKGMKASAAAAEAIVAVANKIPEEGGIFQALMGTQDIASFGEKVVAFIDSMKDANDALTDVSIDSQKFKDAADAAGPMVTLSYAIQKTGGIIQDILGVGDLGDFGEKVYKYVEQIQLASGLLNSSESSGIDKGAIETAAQAGKFMAKLEGAVPKKGGVLQGLLGEQNLYTFGLRIKQYCHQLSLASKKLKENPINRTAITSAANMGELLAGIENSLDKHDGVKQFFTGDNTIDDFGYRLEQFAASMLMFSDIITGNAEDYNHPFDNKAVTSAVTSLNYLWNFVKRIEGSAAANGGEAFVDFTKAITGFGDSIDQILQFFNTLGAEVLSRENFDLSELPGKCEEVGKWIIESIINGAIASLYVEDKNGKGETINAIGKAIADSIMSKEVKTRVFISGTTLGERFTSGFSEQLGLSEKGGTDKLGDKVVSAFESLIDAIESIGGSDQTLQRFYNIGDTWISRVKSGMTSFSSIDGAKRAARFIADGIITVLNSYVHDTQYGFGAFKTAGYNFAAGLANGIYEGAGLVYEAASNLAKNALAEVETTLDEHSPSKATAKDGMYFSLGFAKGIVEHIGDAEDASEMLAAKSLERFKSTASLIGSMVQEAMDAEEHQPTITPVVDLSQIQNGMTLANTMLSGANATLGIGGLKYANSSLQGAQFNVDGTNAMNYTEIVSAINGVRSDVKTLGEAMSSMEVMLDTGAMVGEMGNGMDRKLGSIQKMKERWA